jgi:hypothetical protein
MLSSLVSKSSSDAAPGRQNLLVIISKLPLNFGQLQKSLQRIGRCILLNASFDSILGLAKNVSP